MKKSLKFVSFLIICFMLIFSTTFTYASGVDEEVVIKNILNSILSVVSWFAYAIALGVMIFIGIKYVMSGADERANLKGMLPRYLIGMALIVMCFTIASMVADLAGNDTAEEVIDVGAGDAEVIDYTNTSSDDTFGKTYKVLNEKGGNVVVNYPSEIEINYIDKAGKDPTVIAPLKAGGKTFSHWNVKRTSKKDGTIEEYTSSSSSFEAVGSDGVLGFGIDYTYELEPIYE